MASILIKNGRVWDGERFFLADVLTKGDKIVKIAPCIDDGADFTYDAVGKTVSTGLVDVHVHLRGISSEAFGIQGEAACFPFGVTAAADAGGGRGDMSLLQSFMLKTAVIVGVSIRDNHVDEERTTKKLALYGDSAIGLKVYFDTTVSEVRDITPLREACRLARKLGLFVMVHCASSPTPMGEILDTLSAGDILTHSFHGGVHTAAEDDFAAMRRAKARGVIIDAGFAGHVHTDFAVCRAAVAAGLAPDTISTDVTRYSAYMRGGRYGMTMCMNMARALGMSEEAIFRAVTSTPAKVLGKEKEWGHLRVGGKVDIAVFEDADEGFSLTDKRGNSLESARGYRCLLTVADGQIIYRH